MGQLLILVGSVLIISALAGSIATYLNDRDRRNGKGRSVILFGLGTLLSGLLAGWLFILAAAPALCVVFSGEACGWSAAIIGVPAFFAIGVATFVYFWVLRGNTLTHHSSGTR